MSFLGILPDMDSAPSRVRPAMDCVRDSGDESIVGDQCPDRCGCQAGIGGIVS